MNNFEERKKGYEAKFLQDQEIQFKIRAIRNKLVGEWAAKLFKPEDDSAYIKEVRLSDLEKPGDDDIIEKLIIDFQSKSISIEREEIITKINECEKLAIEVYKKKEA